MKKTDITYVTASAYATISSIFYCCIMYFHIKIPRYYPLENAWKMFKEPGKPSQGWFGTQAFAFLAAGIVTFVIYLILKRTANDTPLKAAAVKRIGIAVSTVVVVSLALILYYQFDKWGIF
jgi:ABC-type Fe3+-siderophore transport system permease subunit